MAGSATFLQHNYPSSTDVAYPADQVPPLWRSKYPIYYTLAAVSSVAGVEPSRQRMHELHARALSALARLDAAGLQGAPLAAMSDWLVLRKY